MIWGLGKTVQALAYIHQHPEKVPVVVIAPSAVKYNWQNEAKKWLGKNRRTEVLEGKKPYQLDDPDIIILNYDIAGGWVEYLASLNLRFSYWMNVTPS